MPESSRRVFLKKTALSVGFVGLQAYLSSCSKRVPRGPSILPDSQAKGFGELIADPAGVMQLPQGFSYKSFSKSGEMMDDGFFVPGAHDGMAAFSGPDGSTILVRNHEMSPGKPENGAFKNDPELFAKAVSEGMYDKSSGDQLCLGGTTTLVFDTKTQSLTQHSLSLAGSIRNCSGGPTPWGSWITCEETVLVKGDYFEKDHGYCFEVPAKAEIGLADPQPIKGMGRFNHEAIAVDPKTSIVYLTEDRHEGLLYRYIPNTPQKMLDGGKLQALAIKGSPSKDTRNWADPEIDSFPIDEEIEVEWIDLDGIDAPDDDLRFRGFKVGAACFARGEGICWGNNSVYFSCTNGGAKKLGQIFRYQPSKYEGTVKESKSPGKIELFIESHESQLLESSDNLTVAPWGDIVIAEDDGPSSFIVGITPKGTLYKIAHVSVDSELAGVCFSPDGSTLFVNIQWNPGQTLAITGPWNKRKA